MNILPKDQKFFDLFQQQTRLIVEAAELLRDGVHGNGADWGSYMSRLTDIEHRGDDVTHETMKRLHQTFITPLDPEDIHNLCLRLDDVLDMIEAIGGQFHIFQMTKFPPPVRMMAENLVSNSHATVQVIEAVAEGRDASALLVKIHDLEDEADQIEYDALVELFKKETDPIKILKLKQIYEMLEEAADQFEEVAHVIEGVVLKNA